MAEEGVVRKLTTIVAIDVVGYSRLMAADEVGTLTRVQENLRQIIQPGAAKHFGRIVKLLGDGVLLEFSSVVDAIRFAVDVQDAFEKPASIEAGAPRLDYRIGVNTGDVIVEGDDLYGDGVNIAARLEAIAEPGEIRVSASVRDHAHGKLDVEFEDLGKQRLKNIPQPVRVYRVVSGRAALPVRPNRRRGRLAVATGIALLAAVAIPVSWLCPWQTAEAPADVAAMAFPMPEKPSIAVLPFNDLSPEGSQTVLAGGLTEDLITDLSKISALFVIAAGSSLAYGDPEMAPKIPAEELGVRFILRGSVRSAGDVLRVNAQLIETTTGRHVWADRFDGAIGDVFAMQDRIVLRIVSALELELTEGEESGITAVETDSIEAKQAFQRGWDLYSRFNPLDNARSVRHFKKAIEIDPGYGRAYAALALVYLRGSIFQWEKPLGESQGQLYREFVPRYLRQAEEHGTALVHVVRAMQHLFYRHGAKPEGANRGTDDARSEATAAIAASPNDPEAHVMMGWALIAGGRPREGLNFVQAAQRLNPNYPSHYIFFEAAAHIGMDQLEQAADILESGLEREPDATALLPLAASVYAHLGRRDVAQAAIRAWRPGETADEIRAAIAHFEYPIRWVKEDAWRNIHLLDGLNVATLPMDVTAASLLEELDHQALADQRRTVEKIGWLGPASAPAVPRLIRLLGNDDKLLRKEAIIALGKIGPAAGDAIEALNDLADLPLLGYHARNAIDRIGGN